MSIIPTPNIMQRLSAAHSTTPTAKIVQMMHGAAKQGKFQLELLNVPRDGEYTKEVMQHFEEAGYTVEWRGPTKHAQDWIIRW